jgi:hypothetical protein
MSVFLKFLFIAGLSLFLSNCDNSDECLDCNNDIPGKQSVLKISKGSNFSVEELMTLLKRDISQIENHVLSKGYHFQNSSETDSSFVVNYKYFKDGFHYYFTATAPKPGKKFGMDLSWSFVDENNKNSLDTLYSHLKTEAEKKGFELYNYGSNSNPTGNKAITNFAYSLRDNPKNSYPVTLVDFNISKLGPSNMPCYNIMIRTVLD